MNYRYGDTMETEKWKDIKKRLDVKESEKNGIVTLKPVQNCNICNGTGISKYIYDCGASNCKGHNDIICSCTRLDIDCPYQNEHVNIYGNWKTIYRDNIIYVECYNSDFHKNNKNRKLKKLNDNQNSTLFEIINLNNINNFIN